MTAFFVIDSGIEFEEMGVVQSWKTLKMYVCCYRCSVLVPVHILANVGVLFVCVTSVLGKCTIWSATFPIYAHGIQPVQNVILFSKLCIRSVPHEVCQTMYIECSTWGVPNLRILLCESYLVKKKFYVDTRLIIHHYTAASFSVYVTLTDSFTIYMFCCTAQIRNEATY
jgi:hypothetical protein